jgi:hypothetical protein
VCGQRAELLLLLLLLLLLQLILWLESQGVVLCWSPVLAFGPFILGPGLFISVLCRCVPF